MMKLSQKDSFFSKNKLIFQDPVNDSAARPIKVAAFITVLTSLCSDEAVQISLPLNEVFSWKTEFYSFGSYKGTCDFGVLGAAVVKFEEDIPVKASFVCPVNKTRYPAMGRIQTPSEWVLGWHVGRFWRGGFCCCFSFHRLNFLSFRNFFFLPRVSLRSFRPAFYPWWRCFFFGLVLIFRYFVAVG